MQIINFQNFKVSIWNSIAPIIHRVVEQFKEKMEQFGLWLEVFQGITVTTGEVWACITATIGACISAPAKLQLS